MRADRVRDGGKAIILAIMPTPGPCRVFRALKPRPPDWAGRRGARQRAGRSSGVGVRSRLVMTGLGFEEKMDTLIGVGTFRPARDTWCIRLRVLTGLREAVHARA